MRPGKESIGIAGVLPAAVLLALAGCHYEMPLVDSPTRPVQAQLLGNWATTDNQLQLKVRRWDDSTYLISFNTGVFRAVHADFAGLQLAEFRQLEPDGRKYAIAFWQLSEDGNTLAVRLFGDNAIPPATRTTAELREAVERASREPHSFPFVVVFHKSAAAFP